MRLRNGQNAILILVALLGLYGAAVSVWIQNIRVYFLIEWKITHKNGFWWFPCESVVFYLANLLYALSTNEVCVSNVAT